MAVQPSGTVTMLFTDVEGSTQLLGRLGAERYADVLEQHNRLLSQAFARHAGYEVDTTGDSFFVSFGRVGDAASAAGEAQRSLAAATWPDGVSMRVRMAIHTGEPLMVDSKYVGMDVHRAARIMAAAHGGQVLVSETTAPLLDGIPLRDLGLHRLKDLLAPIRLHQLLLDGLPDEFPPPRSLYRTNLPTAGWPLVGRRRELERIQALISDEIRLVTLTGPGGAGKTRLALQAAAELSDEFPDGVYFVPLAPLRNASMVIATIAEAVGLQPDDDLVRALRSKRLLLVLDNLEHLRSIASVVADVLIGETTVVATSRTPLRLSGERELVVDPLADDAAIELFVSRAAASGREVPADETVAAVCRRLDNLPLALELAAARVKLLSPSTLLQRLDSALPLLTGGGSDRPERQRTLRATIEWSHDLLDPGARAAFRRMSVFRGSFTLEAAEAITDAQLDELAALVDQSLIKPLGNERFFLLETLREYAAEQLDAAGETATYVLRHAHWYLERLEENHPEMRGPGRAVALAWFVSEEDNLRAMLDGLIAAAAAEAADAAALLHRWWVARNAYGEPRQRFTQLLARDDLSDQSRARLLLCLGTVESRAGNHHASEAAAREIVALAEPGNLDYAQALNLLAGVAIDRGEVEEAVNLGGLALGAAESLDDLTRAQIQSDVGEVFAEGGRTEEARAIARETREVFLRNHDELFVAVSDFILGRYDLYERKYESAYETLVSALATIRRVGGHRGYEAETLRYLSFALLGLGRRADARASCLEALEIAFADNPAPTREVTDALGGVALAADSTEAAGAARLRAAAARLRETAMLAGLPRLMELEQEFERRLTEALGSEGWAEEWAIGAALTLDDAVALARSLGRASGLAAPPRCPAG